MSSVRAKFASLAIRRILVLTTILAILITAAALYAMYTGQVPWWLWLAILAMGVPLGIALLARFAAPIYLDRLRRFS